MNTKTGVVIQASRVVALNKEKEKLLHTKIGVIIQVDLVIVDWKKE